MRYYVADIRTGAMLGELPSLQIDQDLEARLGTYKTGAFKLPVLDDYTPADWRDLIRPWRVAYVVCDDDDQIMGGGAWVPESWQVGPDSVVSLSCVTLEKWFDKLYVGDFEFAQKDQTSVIAHDLVFYTTHQDTGVGIPLTLETPATGVKRDREYFADEDARLLTRLQQLAEVSDGFDFTIETRWADDSHSAFEFVFKTGYPYLGTVTDDPLPVFEMYTGSRTSVTDFSYQSMYGDGYYANAVQAVGDGQGEDKPYSQVFGPAVSAEPLIQYRESESGVTDEDDLDAKAQGIAESMVNGVEQIEITARIDQYPTPADIKLGDSVRVEIGTDAVEFSKVYRMIGYTIDYTAQTWKPTLYANSQILDEAGDDGSDDG